MRPISFIHLSIVAAANAATVPLGTRNTNSIIKWTKCDPALEKAKTSNFSIECANVTAPLDYTQRDCKDTITLELIRVPAAKEPSKGSILFNFGGPGDAGRSGMVDQMDKLMPYAMRPVCII